MTMKELLELLISCAAMGTIIGGMLVAWAKFKWENKFVEKGELYAQDGRQLYQPRTDCRVMHNEANQQGREIKNMIEDISKDLNRLNGCVQNLSGQFNQFVKDHNKVH